MVVERQVVGEAQVGAVVEALQPEQVQTGAQIVEALARCEREQQVVGVVADRAYARIAAQPRAALEARAEQRVELAVLVAPQQPDDVADIGLIVAVQHEQPRHPRRAAVLDGDLVRAAQAVVVVVAQHSPAHARKFAQRLRRALDGVVGAAIVDYDHLVDQARHGRQLLDDAGDLGCTAIRRDEQEDAFSVHRGRSWCGWRTATT